MIEDEEEFNRVVAHLENLPQDLSETELSDHEDALITLEDEDGNSHDFAVVDIIEVDGKEYALLAPAEPLEAEDGSIGHSASSVPAQDPGL
ncbi:MAG: DUF1292 domain-containing protein [Cyanobacteria bacterium REEB65]|nr:DUF1292 domain-containing protein [Cyanobacteria bacterium REEB65]